MLSVGPVSRWLNAFVFDTTPETVAVNNVVTPADDVLGHGSGAPGHSPQEKGSSEEFAGEIAGPMGLCPKPRS